MWFSPLVQPKTIQQLLLNYCCSILYCGSRLMYLSNLSVLCPQSREYYIVIIELPLLCVCTVHCWIPCTENFFVTILNLGNVLCPNGVPSVGIYITVPWQCAVPPWYTIWIFLYYSTVPWQCAVPPWCNIWRYLYYCTLAMCCAPMVYHLNTIHWQCSVPPWCTI
jgi:hypothetical protein